MRTGCPGPGVTADRLRALLDRLAAVAEAPLSTAAGKVRYAMGQPEGAALGLGAGAGLAKR